jgi:hypothetical protein
LRRVFIQANNALIQSVDRAPSELTGICN